MAYKNYSEGTLDGYKIVIIDSVFHWNIWIYKVKFTSDIGDMSWIEYLTNKELKGFRSKII